MGVEVMSFRLPWRLPWMNSFPYLAKPLDEAAASDRTAKRGTRRGGPRGPESVGDLGREDWQSAWGRGSRFYRGRGDGKFGKPGANDPASPERSGSGVISGPEGALAATARNT